jgi:phage terminase small subunit
VKKYKSPSDNPVFKKYWQIFLPEIMARPNFKEVHLHQLELLCDLYLEYYNLKAIIELDGYTYVSEGRNGTQVKISPEVQQMNKCRAEIRNYSRMLGIALMKDNEPTVTDEEEEWE